jgi:exodeoxyribonuclease VII large subunit
VPPTSGCAGACVERRGHRQRTHVGDPHFFEVGRGDNRKVWNTGHICISLKDERAQVKAIMFRSALRYLKFKPEDGLHVIARGRVSVYEPKGEYQFVCEHLEPHGFGARQVAFEQLKKKLQAEGLFDQARKRPLPSLPRKIGVVTSLAARRFATSSRSCAAGIPTRTS